MIYLDNAATSGKKPETVYSAVNDALVNHCGNPGRAGHRIARSAGLIVENARMKCASLFGKVLKLLWFRQILIPASTRSRYAELSGKIQLL